MTRSSKAKCEADEEADEERNELREEVGKRPPDVASERKCSDTEQKARDNKPNVAPLEGVFGCTIFGVAVSLQFAQRK